MSRNFWIFLSLSILLHWITSVGLWSIPSYPIDPLEPVELTLVEDESSSKKLQIVRETDVPQNQIEEEDNSQARFLSNQKQRVVLETKAAQTGKTVNRTDSVAQKSFLQKEAQKSLENYEPIPQIPTTNNSSFAPSTTGELIPDDIAIGSLTALNTERFQYYSFFSRIEDLVRVRWETNVQRAAERAVSQQQKDKWTTRVEFLIKKDGHYHSSRILERSGIPGFDASSILAFKDAAFFPNPPPELVEGDGFIHLKYSFTVNWNPRHIVRTNY